MISLGDETFRQQIRKKVLDMKSDQQDFYTETYNLVHTLIRLNPDAFTENTNNLLKEKLKELYDNPSKKHKLTLSQLEKSYFTHRADPNIRFRSRNRIDLIDIKHVLDKVRQDTLVNMSFNMGTSGLMRFKKMFKAIEDEDWERAGREMLNSRWARQVGTRAEELSLQMVTGERANG